jgi:hypothetical protein
MAAKKTPRSASTAKAAGKDVPRRRVSPSAMPAPVSRAAKVKAVAEAPAVKAPQPLKPLKPLAAAVKTATLPTAAPSAPLAKAGKTSKTDKADKPKKPKLVRDSFTIPKNEYEVLDALKLRAARAGTPAKKSELLRAGIKALAAMDDAAFGRAVGAVPAIKTGRPANAAP